MIGLLGIAVALQEEHETLVPGCHAGVEHLLDARTDFVPDFAPDFAGRTPQGPGVFLAQRHPAVGVVIKEGEVRAPTHPHGIARSEENADYGLQALGPRHLRTERSPRPVISVYQFVHELFGGRRFR